MLATRHKKKLRRLYKAAVYKLFQWKHGPIKGITAATAHPKVHVKTVQMDKHTYNHVYRIHASRLYTNREIDCAVLLDNHLISGPSFQIRGPEFDAAPPGSILPPILAHKHPHLNEVHRIGTPKPLHHIKGSVLSLIAGATSDCNCYHWLYDTLPRIVLCEHLIQRQHIDYFLLPGNHLAFQRESLAMLDIPKEKQLSSEHYRHILADTLYVTDHPNTNNDYGWITAWLNHTFASKANNHALCSDKIYIDRSDAGTTLQHRSITNENEVQHYLLEHGFDTVRLGDYSFSDQINIFAHAKVIVGLHGAGFANLAFCQPNTKVIEMKSCQANETVANIAHARGLYYQAIARKPINHNAVGQQGHITVPIDLLHAHLKALI